MSRASLLPKKARGPGRPEGRFTQHRRIEGMRELLESQPGGVTLDDLAAVMRVSARSVRRYLKDLKGHLELEPVLTRPGGANLWRIKPQERGRAVSLRRAQAYLLLAARKAFEPLRGSAIFDELDVALRQLLVVAQRPIKTSQTADIPIDGRLEDRLLLWPGSSRSYVDKGPEIDDVFRATAELRLLDLELDDGETCIVQPLALCVHGGRLLVLIANREGSARRIVPLERMSRARCTSEAFHLPPDFDAEAFFAATLGPCAEHDSRRALVEFDARHAADVRGRKFHPQQRIALAKDGRVRLSLPIVDEAAFVRFVLGFGSGAKVLEPSELARRVRDELFVAMRAYR
jgi:predicted DNA-binding transcriptional regulator YafY